MALEQNTVEILKAKRMLFRLSVTDGCEEFNKLISEIRGNAEDGVYTYNQIGVTEIKLVELGLSNARLNAVKGSSSILADLCVIKSYARELLRLRTSSKFGAHPKINCAA